MVEVMKIMATSFKRSHALLHSVPLTLKQATVNPSLHQRLLDPPRQVFSSSLLLSPGSWCAQGFICAFQGSVSAVLCKFWQLYGGVNGDLLQEGLCRTQVSCTQNLCPCGRHGRPVPPQETLKHFLAQSLWGLWVLVHTRFV